MSKNREEIFDKSLTIIQITKYTHTHTHTHTHAYNICSGNVMLKISFFENYCQADPNKKMIRYRRIGETRNVIEIATPMAGDD